MTHSAHHTLNEDQAELEQFAQLNEQWWDPQGPLKPLHAINPARQGFIVQHAGLTQQHPEKALIDIGCGGGILTESLAPYCRTITGIDLNPTLIKTAQQHAAEQALDIDYRCTSLETMVKIHRGQFDVITCLELLEHVPYPYIMVQQCAQLCIPGGLIFFSTIKLVSQ